MIKVKLELVARAIHAARPASHMPQEWCAGVNSACDVITSYLVGELGARNPDFDAQAFMLSVVEGERRE